MMQTIIYLCCTIVRILVSVTSAIAPNPRKPKIQSRIANLGLAFVISGIPLAYASNTDFGIGRIPYVHRAITQPTYPEILGQMDVVRILSILPLVFPRDVAPTAPLWDHEYRDPDAATIEMRLSPGLKTYLMETYYVSVEYDESVSAMLSIFGDSGHPESERLSVGSALVYDVETYTVPSTGFYCYELEVQLSGSPIEQNVAGAYLENGYIYEIAPDSSGNTLSLRQSGKSITILLPSRSEYPLEIVGVIMPGLDNDVLRPVPSELTFGQSAISIPLQTGDYQLVVVHGEPSRTDELRYHLSDQGKFYEVSFDFGSGAFMDKDKYPTYRIYDEQVFLLTVDDGNVNLTETTDFCDANNF